jgi:hypothetical protein
LVEDIRDGIVKLNYGLAPAPANGFGAAHAPAALHTRVLCGSRFAATTAPKKSAASTKAPSGASTKPPGSTEAPGEETYDPNELASSAADTAATNADTSMSASESAQQASEALVDNGVASATTAPFEAASAAANIPVTSLTTEQWQQVYQNNNLLRGKTITSAGKANSQYPAFVFKSGLEAPNYVTDWQSYQDSQSVSGMQAATESAEGYTSVSASVSSPWVSASADTAGSSSDADTGSSSSEYSVTSYNYPRTQIWVESFLALSPQCLADLNAALSQPTNAAKCKALVTFFQNYGQVMPSKVTLGGKMYNIAQAGTSASNSSSGSNKSTSASAGVSYDGVGASAGVDTGSTNSSANSGSSANASNNWSTIGGNSLLSGNVTQWTPTVAYPENWGIIVYDEMIDFSASPLFPVSARKQLNELMTTPEYTLVFGTGSSSPSLASSTAGDAILGIVQIPDSSGSNYLSIPHSSNPGAMAFFRNGCFTTNTNVPQPCTVQMTGCLGITVKKYFINIYPANNSSDALMSPHEKNSTNASFSNLTISWDIDPTANYVFELWDYGGVNSVAASSTYTGAQLLANLGSNYSYAMGSDGNVNVLINRTAAAQAYYESQLAVANTTLWTVAAYSSGYSLESVDTPGLYLSAGSNGHLTVQSMSASSNTNATWYIYKSGTQYAFVNLKTLQALTMGDDKVYVTQATTSQLANASTMTPTSTQAAAQVSGYVATTSTYNSYSPAATNLFTVETDMDKQTTQTGSPELVIYCPCCSTSPFDTFSIGTGSSPLTFQTDMWKTYNANQCYVESVDSNDLVFNTPTVSSGSISVSVQSGQTPPTNPGLVMGCCYTATPSSISSAAATASSAAATTAPA